MPNCSLVSISYQYHSELNAEKEINYNKLKGKSISSKEIVQKQYNESRDRVEHTFQMTDCD